MKQIKLLTLEIENFKGVRARTIHADGANLRICGKNGTGKTTNYDALCWLLFGKDSHGNSPDTADFEIKPRAADGSTSMGLSPTVTAVLGVDGEPVKLRKVFREKWVTQRGSSEPKFSGNTTECTIDDVPRGAGEYADMVGKIVDEQRFLLLTNVYCFARDMSTRDRRKLLFELCGTRCDRELMASEPRFEDLLDGIGNLSVEDYKTAQKARRRKVSERYEAIPVRIEECEKTKQGLGGIEFDALRLELSEHEIERERLAGELVQLDNDTALAAARNKRDGLKNDIARLQGENNAHRNSQFAPVGDPRDELRMALAAAKQMRERVQGQIDTAKGENDMADMRLSDYRHRWNAIKAERFAADACPTCGQKLPSDKLAEAQARFESGKKTRQEALMKDSELLKDGIRRRQDQMEVWAAEIDRANKEAGRLARELEAVPEPKETAIEDLPKFAENETRLLGELSEAESAISGILSGGTIRRESLRGQLAEIDGRMETLREGLAQQRTLEQMEERIRQLQEEHSAHFAELDHIDSLLDLCEQFTRFKADSLTAAVNERFCGVQFRLFKIQQNGGLEDRCDVMQDGKPYGTLSDGEKIKVGLSIIESLSGFYGVRVPLFVDGAESVTDFPAMDTQVIRLVVSDADEEMRITV